MAAHDAPDGLAFAAAGDGLRFSGRATAMAQGGLDLRLGQLPGFRALGPDWSASLELRGITHEAGSWLARLHRASLQFAGTRHQATLGRAPFIWTRAPSGRSLLYGRSARPRWHLGWHTRQPLDLPWLSEGWGSWSGAAFLAYLDDNDRTIADPLLLGHRASWLPRPWFEATATRTILFGGDGRTGRLTPKAIWNILTAQNENIVGDRPPSDSDQRASFTLTLRPLWLTHRIPHLEALEIFYEYAGEDMLHPPIPSAVAHHHGARAQVAGWSVAGEFAETVTGANRWYFHTIYKDAYFYQGLPLGLPQISDARSLWFSLQSPPAPVRARLDWSEATYGVRRGVRELRVRWAAEVEMTVHPRVDLAVGFAGTDRRGGEAEPRAPGYVSSMTSLRMIVR